MERPALTTVEQARDDLGIPDAGTRIARWVREGKLVSAGTYCPPDGKAQPLYRTARVVALAEGKVA